MSDLVAAGASRLDRPGSDSFDGDLVDVARYAYTGFSHGTGHRRPPQEAPYGLPALLAQAEWWRPQAAPPLRVRDMTDTHRLHTARFVLNRAASAYGIHPEQVKASPLFGALIAGLPRPGARGWDDLLERATHWSTCPRNASLTAPACSPDCRPRTEAYHAARELMVDYDGDAAGRNGL